MRVDNYKMKLKLNSLYVQSVYDTDRRPFQQHEISQIITDRENGIAYIYCSHWKTPRRFTSAALPNMCVNWMLTKANMVSINKRITIFTRRRLAWDEKYF